MIRPEQTSPDLTAPGLRLFAADGLDPRPLDGPALDIELDDFPLVDRKDRRFGDLTPALARSMPETAGGREAIETDLRTAGGQSLGAYANLSATRYVASVGSILIFGFLLLIVPPAWEPLCVGGLGAGMLTGWLLPPVLVRRRAARRAAAIARGLPDLIELMQMAVPEGLAVPSALHHAGRGIRLAHPALAEELTIIDRQVDLAGWDESLGNFRRRIPIAEVDAFVSAIVEDSPGNSDASTRLIECAERIDVELRDRAARETSQVFARRLVPGLACLVVAIGLILYGARVIDSPRLLPTAAVAPPVDSLDDE